MKASSSSTGPGNHPDETAAIGVYKGRLDRYLSGTGKRRTIERCEVLEAVVAAFAKAEQDGRRHITVQEIFAQIKHQGSPLALATVYRALPLLWGAGILEEVPHSGGRVLYELADGKPHHDHLFCLDCGRVIEFESQQIEELQEEICARLGFRMTGHTLCIRGQCRCCSGDGTDTDRGEDRGGTP
jgi:Fur family ferric uptake transcriptional regulator